MGEFSILTIKLLFLFLPGIVYRLLYERWLIRPKRHFNIFIIYSFIASLVFYGLYYLIFVKITGIKSQVFFMNNLLNTNDISLHYTEIFWTLIIALISVYIISWEKSHKRIYKLLTKLKFIETILEFFKPTFVEQTLGVWDYIFDNCEDNECWVKIHNLQEKVIYYGWVDKYSEEVKNNELYLTDVEVLDLQGDELYSIPGLYIAQTEGNIIIEFINKGAKENDRKKISKSTTKSKSKQSKN